jgi:hypothetical protein
MPVRGASRIEVFQRIGDQVPVEDAVDRAPQAQRRHALPRLAGEQGAGAPVVEQHAAVHVADDDALRQFRHEYGEAVAVRLGGGVGGADARLDFLVARLVLPGQAIDGADQGLQLRATLQAEAGRRLRQHRPRLLGRPRRRQHQEFMNGAQDQEEEDAGEHHDHHHDTQATLQNGLDHGPLLSLQPGTEDGQGRRQHGDEAGAGDEDGGDQLHAGIHGALGFPKRRPDLKPVRSGP